MSTIVKCLELAYAKIACLHPIIEAPTGFVAYESAWPSLNAMYATGAFEVDTVELRDGFYAKSKTL